MTPRTISSNMEIHDMLDRSRHREASDACRHALANAEGVPPETVRDTRILMAWALLLQGKLSEAMIFAESGAGQTLASVCVYQLYSNDVGKPMVNALRWAEQSVLFWDKLLSADPGNKDILARRDFVKERQAWYYAHLETDKYEPAHRAGSEVFS